MELDPQPSLFSLADAAAFRGVIDAVPHPIFVKDEQTRFVIMNDMMCNLMNRTSDQLVGKTDYDFVPKEQADVFRGNDLRVLSTGEINENEELFSDGDGGLRTIVTRKKRLILPDGRRVLVGCITDISDFRQAEALVRYNAEHDALTGLPNRRLFANKTKEAATRASRSPAAYSVLLIDLDRFKPVNDVYGHTAGDAVLCEIATRLKDIVRAGDTVARIGGDEFAIISESNMASETSAEAARRLAARVIASIQAPISVGDHMVDVGASIGIAQCPQDGTDPEILLRSADVAMYRAKRDGLGQFRFFEESMDAEIRSQALLEGDLRRAVAQREIQPYYQPLMDLAEGRLVGFEILARWHHPDRGFVPPEVFIPIAERLRLISDLTFTLLRTACQDARGWPDDLILALNLSPVQLTDSMLPMQIHAILKEAGFSPSRLEIEITESALVSDLMTAKSILTSFQNLGMKISLDDFGTGYSSMYHLRELRFDKIKIDRSFILSMQSNPESAKIVNAIIGLTKSLGLTTTAEGIEDANAMMRMIESGCEFGQGFHFGKAVPASEVAELIARSRGIVGDARLAAG
jgi:diguanylate cyclase (GGDEF)-like protein/PAS domain S-box-containing protein